MEGGGVLSEQFRACLYTCKWAIRRPKILVGLQTSTKKISALPVSLDRFRLTITQPSFTLKSINNFIQGELFKQLLPSSSFPTISFTTGLEITPAVTTLPHTFIRNFLSSWTKSLPLTKLEFDGATMSSLPSLVEKK